MILPEIAASRYWRGFAVVWWLWYINGRAKVFLSDRCIFVVLLSSRSGDPLFIPYSNLKSKCMKTVNVSKGTLFMDTSPKDGWGNLLPEIHVYLLPVKGNRRKFFGRFSNESALTAMATFERVAHEIGIVGSKYDNYYDNH